MDSGPAKPDRNSAHWTVELGALSGVGMTIGVATTLGVFAGQWADKKWETAPWFTVIGAFLGFAAGIVNLVRVYEFVRSSLDSRPGSGGGPDRERPPDP